MTRMGRRAASSRVASLLPSSTSRTSSTAPAGMACHVRASVRAALYAGMTTTTLLTRTAGRVGWAALAPALLVGIDELLPHRVHHGLHARVQVELLQDVPDVVLHRVLGDVELVGDLAVAHALGHQSQHLELPAGERGGGELLLLLRLLHQSVEFGEQLGS